ncbi:hypothetical protein [Rathayibacter soli]|nr:hypothetical protein [Glaciibacter superstes]
MSGSTAAWKEAHRLLREIRSLAASDRNNPAKGTVAAAFLQAAT